jgi:hypothetical protein
VFDPPTRSAAPQVPPSDWVGPKHLTSPLWRNGSQGWSAWRQGMKLWWNPVVSGTPVPLWTTPETGPLMVPRYVVYPLHPWFLRVKIEGRENGMSSLLKEHGRNVGWRFKGWLRDDSSINISLLLFQKMEGSQFSGGNWRLWREGIG